MAFQANGIGKKRTGFFKNKMYIAHIQGTYIKYAYICVLIYVLSVNKI